MPLPATIAPGRYITGITALKNAVALDEINHPRITGPRVKRFERRCHCSFTNNVSVRSPAIVMSRGGSDNCMLVGYIANGVGFGRLNMPRGKKVHVLSDQYGGCQWHILCNPGRAVAFLHVFRESGVVAPYQLGGPWVHRATLHSQPAAAQFGTTRDILSYAYVQPGSNIAECCMLVLSQQGMIEHVVQYQAVNIG